MTNVGNRDTRHDERDLTSRRIFLPHPQHPKRTAAYFDLLTTMGLHEKAQALALNSLRLASGESVLHVPCGSGALTVELKRRWPNHEIEGIDPNDASLEVASEWATEARADILFSKGYLRDLPATAEQFDWIVALLALHPFRGPERAAVFEEFRRVLKPEGRILLVDFSDAPRGLGGWLVKRLARLEPGIAEQLQVGLGELLRRHAFREVASAGRSALGLEALIAKRPAP